MFQILSLPGEMSFRGNNNILLLIDLTQGEKYLASHYFYYFYRLLSQNHALTWIHLDGSREW